MRAAKLYALGGLLMISGVLLRSFWLGWPWEPAYVVGLSRAAAQLFTWPLVAALGAAALFLSTLQSQVEFPERVKIGGAVVYFIAAVVSVSSLYSDFLRDRPWETPVSWTTGAGLALLLAALMLNFVGILRHKETPATAGAVESV